MTPAAKISEVPNFGKKLVMVAGREILLINIKGAFFAVENECPHQGSPMTGGIVRDDAISCPRHGYRFNLADGTCREHPEFTLQTFPVEISGDMIMVQIA